MRASSELCANAGHPLDGGVVIIGDTGKCYCGLYTYFVKPGLEAPMAWKRVLTSEIPPEQPKSRMLVDLERAHEALYPGAEMGDGCGLCDAWALAQVFLQRMESVGGMVELDAEAKRLYAEHKWDLYMSDPDKGPA